MKKIWALIMAVHLFSGNVLMAEIGKLPFLWQHFFQHQEKGNELSVLEFLTLHYSNDRHHHSDLEHHHLPLVSLHVVPAMLALHPDTLDVLKLRQVPGAAQCTLPPVDQPASSGFRGRLLKPPAIFG